MDIFGNSPILTPIYVEPPFDRSNVVTTSQRKPRTVTGLVDSGAGFSIVQYSDGTTERREDARGVRNNNPGNLTGTLQGALRQGAVAVDHGGNYVFPDQQTGQRAMANFVLNRNSDKTIADMLGVYAPAGAANDPNNTNRLYPGMVNNAGFKLGDTVGALPAAEQQRLLDTMMSIETGQPAPARQLATLRSPGRGNAVRAQGMLEQLSKIDPRMAFGHTAGKSVGGGDGGGFRPQFLGDVPDTATPTLPQALQPGAGRGFQPQFPGDVGTVARTYGRGDGSAELAQRRPASTRGDGRKETDRRQQRSSAAEKARVLGLMGDMGAAETLASTAGEAVQEASTRGGIGKPMNKKERQKWSPESLGLITFGLSLLSGSDVAQATQAGLNTYSTVGKQRDLRKQREAVDRFIEQQSPELQEVLRLVGGDNKAIADLTMQFKELQGEQAKAEALQTQVTEADLTPELAAQVAAAKDPAAEFVKIKEASKKSAAGFDAMQQRHDLVMEQIQVVREMILGGSRLNEATGEIQTRKGMANDANPLDFVMGVTQAIPRTRANDYRKNLDTLRANIGFNELNRLRQMSPTGGALGQVTERELAFLQNVLGDLGVNTRYDTVLRALDNAEASFARMLGAAQADYGTYFVTPRSSPTASGGGAQTIDMGGTSYNVRQN